VLLFADQFKQRLISVSRCVSDGVVVGQMQSAVDAEPRPTPESLEQQIGQGQDCSRLEIKRPEECMRICAMTNVYNESFNLPIWLKYYGEQLGYKNCIVIDHASTDGSTEFLNGAGHIYFPPGPFDDRERSKRISALANAMLETYDVVIYTDCDEIIVADPREYASLPDFCEKNYGDCATTIGLDLIHNLACEKPFEEGKNILSQRKYALFSGACCKTLLIRKKVVWGGGFHSSSFAPQFGGLFLFHLRCVDLGETLRRLAITQEIPRADPHQGIHQVESFMRYVDRFRWFAKLDVEIDDEFRFENYISEVKAATTITPGGLYRVGTKVRSVGQHIVPEAFSGIF
jgi:hypothetical protein